MKNNEWWTRESIVDEYAFNNFEVISIEEYSDNKGVLFTIEYSLYDDYDNTICNKIVFKSRKEDTVRRMFKHYVDLLEEMNKAVDRYEERDKYNKELKNV